MDRDRFVGDSNSDDPLRRAIHDWLDPDRFKRGDSQDAAAADTPHLGLDDSRRFRALQGETSSGHDSSRPRSIGPPPERVGPYVVLGALGSGGVGQVYRAEDTRTGASVALKLLREEWRSSPRELERFRREADAAKLVSHPNCVKLLDSGVTNDRPYVVYELVEGVGLDERLRVARASGQRLPLATTLTLGREIADALAALHEKRLYHRDVKPANIRIRGDGRAVLLDFGLVTGMSLETLTRTGEFAGSLPYAAPEQVASGARDVDARADLYSLAATLYECLTGLPVFAGASMEQVIVSIVNDDPLPVNRLVPTLPRVFDLVLSKALEKDPTHRYSTMREFSDDLRALVSGGPIAARPPSLLRTIGKLARRRPGVSATIVAAVLLLTVVPGLLYVRESIVARRLREESARTAEQQARAEENLLRSIEALAGIVARAEDPALRAHAGTEPVRRQMLEDARKCFDTLLAANIQNTDLAVGSARALHRLGALCVDLGDLDAGETAYRSAIERMRAALTSVPNDPTYHQDLADGLDGLGTILQSRGDHAAAEASWREAIEHSSKVVAIGGSPLQRRSLARIQNHLASFLQERGRLLEAIELYEHALDQQKIVLANAADPLLDLEVLAAKSRLALTYSELALRDPSAPLRDRAIAIDREVIATIESRFTPTPDNESLETLLGATWFRLALDEDRRGDDVAADSAFARALEIQERLCARSPEKPRYAVDCAKTLVSRGDRLLRTGKFEEARADNLAARERVEAAIARSPDDPDLAKLKTRIDEALEGTREPASDR